MIARQVLRDLLDVEAKVALHLQRLQLGLGADGDRERLRLALAQDAHRDLLTGLRARDQALQVAEILFLLGLLLHLSVTFSSLEEKVRVLAEEVALQRSDSPQAGASIEEPDQRQDEADPSGEDGRHD